MQENDANKLYEVRLKWDSVEDLDTKYVNQLLISHSGPEFYLTFGELSIPTFMSEDEIPKEMKIKPVVRLAITPNAMRSISDVIHENVKRYSRLENK